MRARSSTNVLTDSTLSIDLPVCPALHLLDAHNYFARPSHFFANASSLSAFINTPPTTLRA